MKLSAKQLTDSAKLSFLDGLRGLAAFYVMAGHARWLLWEGYEEFSKHTHTYNFFNKCLVYAFSLLRYGHEVVLFFFVLSGFVIHLKYAKALRLKQKKTIDYSEYLWKRFRRIYPPFIAAILLTAVLDYIGSYLGLSIYEGKTNNHLINTSVGNPDFRPGTVIGNLFFLYENYFPVFGTNGPAWSLKYEWWFYMFFPAFLVLGKKNIWYPSSAITLLFALSFFPELWPEKLLPDIFSMMLTWWLGVILAEVYAGRVRVNIRLLALFMSAILLFFMPYNFSAVWSDLIMAFFFLGLLALLLSIRGDHRIKVGLSRLRFMGNFSYTLYIIHFPILTFLAGVVIKNHDNMQPTHFGYVVIGMVVSLLVSYLVHFVTEVPFMGVHSKVGKTLSHKEQAC